MKDVVGQLDTEEHCRIALLRKVSFAHAVGRVLLKNLGSPATLL